MFSPSHSPTVGHGVALLGRPPAPLHNITVQVRMCNDVHLHNFRAGIDEEKITIFLKIKATMEMFQQKHREQHD